MNRSPSVVVKRFVQEQRQRSARILHFRDESQAHRQQQLGPRAVRKFVQGLAPAGLFVEGREPGFGAGRAQQFEPVAAAREPVQQLRRGVQHGRPRRRGILFAQVGHQPVGQGGAARRRAFLEQAFVRAFPLGQSLLEPAPGARRGQFGFQGGDALEKFRRPRGGVFGRSQPGSQFVLRQRQQRRFGRSDARGQRGPGGIARFGGRAPGRVPAGQRVGLIVTGAVGRQFQPGAHARQVGGSPRRAGGRLHPAAPAVGPPTG